MVFETQTAIAATAVKPEPPISLHGLYKRFGQTMAVRGINLEIQ
jgi:hypothetical protein